mgnify:CR=1 FL=1
MPSALRQDRPGIKVFLYPGTDVLTYNYSAKKFSLLSVLAPKTISYSIVSRFSKENGTINRGKHNKSKISI